MDYLTVSALNKYVKSLFDNTPTLNGILIKGEISNFKKHITGTYYFTLKDNECSISAVMFKDCAINCPEEIKEGVEVIVTANVSLFPQRGTYQLYVSRIELYGRGAILEKLEKLKHKLQSEGLFDESKKRPLPLYPSRIGVISGNKSAALKDIVTNIERRYPIAEVYVFPSLVQGEGASEDLRRALKEAKSYSLDILIIGRGGGANEDLSAFNDEKLIRDIADYPVPTISAVGHEVDITLTDYVCDKRASTPTGAAELACIDKREIISKLNNSIDRLNSFIKEYLRSLRSEIEVRENLDNLINERISDEKENLVLKKKYLEALNPKSILNRGYTLVYNSNKNLITSIKNINVNDELSIAFKDGSVVSKVKTLKEIKNGEEN